MFSWSKTSTFWLTIWALFSLDFKPCKVIKYLKVVFTWHGGMSAWFRIEKSSFLDRVGCQAWCHIEKSSLLDRVGCQAWCRIVKLSLYYMYRVGCQAWCRIEKSSLYYTGWDVRPGAGAQQWELRHAVLPPLQPAPGHRQIFMVRHFELQLYPFAEGFTLSFCALVAVHVIRTSFLLLNTVQCTLVLLNVLKVGLCNEIDGERNGWWLVSETWTATPRNCKISPNRLKEVCWTLRHFFWWLRPWNTNGLLYWKIAS